MKIRLENLVGQQIQNVEIETDHMSDSIPDAIVYGIPSTGHFGAVFCLVPGQEAAHRYNPDAIWVYRSAMVTYTVTSENCRDENFEGPR